MTKDAEGEVNNALLSAIGWLMTLVSGVIVLAICGAVGVVVLGVLSWAWRQL
jgi:hypothetical protein